MTFNSLCVTFCPNVTFLALLNTNVFTHISEILLILEGGVAPGQSISESEAGQGVTQKVCSIGQHNIGCCIIILCNPSHMVQHWHRHPRYPFALALHGILI